MKFKSESGITLTSLIIYVIAMLITITIITVLTGYFAKNVDLDPESYTFYSEFTKFESSFSEEVTRKNNIILEIKNGSDNNQSYIAFSSGNQYTYVPKNKAIYKNNVKITGGVENCSFKEKNQNGIPAVEVSITIKGNKEEKSQSRTTTYTLQD